MIRGRKLRNIGMSTIVKKVLAAINANIKFLFIKLGHWSSVKYSPLSRTFKGVSITVRNGGILEVGKNLKVEKNATLVCNGGHLKMGEDVGIGSNDSIVCQNEVFIGNGTIFAPNVMVYDHDHVYSPESGVDQKHFNKTPIKIGNNVWIGANTVILRGTNIGDNCVVGAGSVIKGEYPAGSVILQKRETIARGVK